MGRAAKTWFITGTSTGFGRHWVEAALERGDWVIPTARRPEAIAELPERFGRAVLVLELDVVEREAVFQAIQRGHEHFGALDVVVNNAGYGHFGMVEELSEQSFGTRWRRTSSAPCG